MVVTAICPEVALEAMALPFYFSVGDCNLVSPSPVSLPETNPHPNGLSSLFSAAIDQEYLVSVSVGMRHCPYDFYAEDWRHCRCPFAAFLEEMHLNPVFSFALPGNDYIASELGISQRFGHDALAEKCPHFLGLRN